MHFLPSEIVVLIIIFEIIVSHEQLYSFNIFIYNFYTFAKIELNYPCLSAFYIVTVVTVVIVAINDRDNHACINVRFFLFLTF